MHWGLDIGIGREDDGIDAQIHTNHHGSSCLRGLEDRESINPLRVDLAAPAIVSNKFCIWGVNSWRSASLVEKQTAQ
jgi:hypothetical protein